MTDQDDVLVIGGGMAGLSGETEGFVKLIAEKRWVHPWVPHRRPEASEIIQAVAISMRAGRRHDSDRTVTHRVAGRRDDDGENRASRRLLWIGV